MDDPIIIAAAAFAGMLGIVIGLVLGLVMGRRNRQSKDEVAEPIPVPPPPPLPPARHVSKDSVEVLSLWLNERTGKLLAMLETKPVSPSHLTTEQKTKISQLLASLHSMIGDEAQPPPPRSALTDSPEPTPSALLLNEEASEAIPQPESETDAPSPDAPSTPSRAEKVYFADSLPEPVTLGQALLSNPFRVTPPPASKKPANAPKSIVEQIDEIFQAKLAGSPYENQSIQLKESLNGMTILIGSYRYEGIDAVPDPAIRGLIKEAAREWNDKTSRRR